MLSLFSIVDNKDQEIGMIVFTSPISDDIIGFYRSIPMTILMDKDQKSLMSSSTRTMKHHHTCKNWKTKSLLIHLLD